MPRFWSNWLDGLYNDLFLSCHCYTALLQIMCSYIFMPLAVVMGVPIKDARNIGALIGKKLFTNELLAYADLGAMKKSGEIEVRNIWWYAERTLKDNF